MVAIQRSNSKPKFLVDRGKKFSMLYHEVSADVENNNTAGAPSVHVSTSEGGDSFPFHMRITIEQSSKMLRSEILWILNTPVVMKLGLIICYYKSNLRTSLS